jgi:hypothetical protein
MAAANLSAPPGERQVGRDATHDQHHHGIRPALTYCTALVDPDAQDSRSSMSFRLLNPPSTLHPDDANEASDPEGDTRIQRPRRDDIILVFFDVRDLAGANYVPAQPLSRPPSLTPLRHSPLPRPLLRGGILPGSTSARGRAVYHFTGRTRICFTARITHSQSPAYVSPLLTLPTSHFASSSTRSTIPPSTDAEAKACSYLCHGSPMLRLTYKPN